MNNEKTLKKYDIHIHLAGAGDGSPCYVSPSMRRSLPYHLLLKYTGLKPGENLDVRYAQQLAGHISSSQLDGGVIFALDAVITDKDEIDWERSHSYIPNDYLFDVCKQHPKWLPGVSINPYRKDAVERLQEAIHQGAVVLKWLPNLQMFNPLDARCNAMYKLLAEKGVPLVAHTGCEHSFPNCDHSMGDVKYYKHALDHGVIVVLCHCGTACPIHPQHNCRKEIFALFKSYDNLFADTSALTSLLKFYQIHKIDFLTFHDRLIHGSDYPIPPLVVPFGFKIGWRKMREVQRIKNPIERDIILKDALGFPKDILTNATKLIQHRVDYWQSR